EHDPRKKERFGRWRYKNGSRRVPPWQVNVVEVDMQELRRFRIRRGGLGSKVADRNCLQPGDFAGGIEQHGHVVRDLLSRGRVVEHERQRTLKPSAFARGGGEELRALPREKL